MAKSKVSQDFLQFSARNQDKFAEAAKEERQIRGINLPVGFSGVGVISDMVADRAKGGQKNPYLRIEATIVEGEYKGEKISRIHSFYESENMTAAGRWAMMLDDLETMGMSREFREENGDDIAALMEHMLNEPHYVNVEVVEGYRKGTKEGVFVHTASPDGIGGAVSAPLPEKPEVPEGATTCKYLNSTYIVIGEEDGKLIIQPAAGGKVRTVDKEHVEM